MTTTTCFHHADRETGRACTRCGRPACPDCLIQASVGSQCFECVRAGAPTTSQRVAAALDPRKPALTTGIIAVTVAAYIYMTPTGANGLRGSFDYELIGFFVDRGEWWRIFTHALVHYGPIHLGFNMFALYQIGKLLEPATGRTRFAALYLVSIIGGALGALLLSPDVATGGASGGVFGIAAAATLVLHRQGISFRDTGFGPLLAINLVFNVVANAAGSNFSIGGHVGGMIAGVVACEIMLRSRRLGQPRLGIVGAALFGVILFFAALAVASS